ncbi:hypothetical protein CAPTEDRAFT_204155, partial [Capitella teleta]
MQPGTLSQFPKNTRTIESMAASGSDCKPCRVVLVDFIKCLNLVQLQGKDKCPQFSNDSGVLVEEKASLTQQTQNWETKMNSISTRLCIQWSPISSSAEPSRKKAEMSKAKMECEEQYLNTIEDQPKPKTVLEGVETGESPRVIFPKPVETLVSPKTTLQIAVETVESPKYPAAMSSPSNCSKSKKPEDSKDSAANNDRFRCLHCPYGASTKQTMVEHIYHHTDIVPYYCGLCGAIFGTKGGVKVHARREHKVIRPLRLIKKRTDIIEELHYTTIEKFEKTGHMMVPPPLPGKQITDRTKSIFDASLKSSLNYSHTSSVPQIEENKIPIKGTDEAMDKRKVHRTRKKTRNREKAALLQGTDISRRYYQCKYCTFFTNYYPVIVQHGSTKHSEYHELLCTYCKYKLVDNAHIKFHYNTQHPGIPINVRLSRDFITIPPPRPPTTPTDVVVCETQIPKDKCPSLMHPLISSLLAEPCPASAESDPGTSTKNCREEAARNGLPARKLESTPQAGDNHTRMKFGVPRYLTNNANPSADFANSRQQLLNTAETIVIQPANVEDISKERVLLNEEGQQNEESSPPLAFKISSIVSLADKPVAQPTTVDKYFCHFCNFSAVDKEPMVDHLDIVHKVDYFFTCSRCPGRKYKKFMMEHVRRVHPGSTSDLCSLIEETKFFEFKPIEETSGDDSSAWPVPSRPRQGSRPVSMVGPMIAGQALHPMDDTGAIEHEAPLPAYSRPAPTVLPARLMAPPLVEATPLPPPPLIHRSMVRAPLQHAAGTHAPPLTRAPAQFHRPPQHIPKQPSPIVVAPITEGEELKALRPAVIQTVEPLSDKEAEARKIYSVFNLKPTQPAGAVPAQPLPPSNPF